MAKWIPLLLYSGDPLIRGTLFKFPRGYPFERNVVVDALRSGRTVRAHHDYWVQSRDSSSCGVREALADGPGSGISPQWLVSNWKFHVWEDANLDDVLIRSADEL